MGVAKKVATSAPGSRQCGVGLQFRVHEVEGYEKVCWKVLRLEIQGLEGKACHEALLHPQLTLPVPVAKAAVVLKTSTESTMAFKSSVLYAGA